MSTSGPTAFTGSSPFSSDLSAYISRAVSFASLPMEQLQGQQATLHSQQGELRTIAGQFQNLQSSLDSINNGTGIQSYSAAVDNPLVASTAVTAGALPGSYSLNVTSVGSHTNTLSNDGLSTVMDPTTGNIDASHAFTLTVDSQTYNISDTGGSLNGLAQAINQSGASVQATVVNVGSSSSPDYRLSVQSTQYSPSAVQLSNGTNSLLNTISAGSYVQYQVNGSTNTVNSSTRSVNLSTGLTVNLNQTGTANITVSQNTAALQNGISSFVSSYNAIVDELTKSRGQNGGVLSGQNIVYDLSAALNSMASYTAPSGSLSTLSDIGVTFDKTGHLQFNSATLGQSNASSVGSALQFFGSETGGGFLKSAANALSSITDVTSGTLTNFSASIQTEITNVGKKITTDQEQIANLQTSLQKQMATADAAISSLQQQLSYVTSLFTAMQTNAQNNNNG